MRAVLEIVEEYPLPPEELRVPGYEMENAPEVIEWLRRMFINEDAPMMNPEHAHLRKADLVAVWTNKVYVEGGVPVVGQAEIIKPSGKPWAVVDKVDRLCILHGKIPQARIWIYGPAWFERGFWRACAVGEHELGHLEQKVDGEGEKVYDDEKNGRPVLCMQAHDVEENVYIMQRYGPDYCAGKSREFVEAALRPPLFAPPSPPFESRPYACGCGKKV